MSIIIDNIYKAKESLVSSKKIKSINKNFKKPYAETGSLNPNWDRSLWCAAGDDVKTEE